MGESGFNGLVALVTGAGQGIGFEVAKQLLLQGARVMINDREDERARIACEKLNEFGKCRYISGDAGDPRFIHSMIKATTREFGKLDIAIANAGITVYGEFLEFSASSFEEIVNLNLRGSFFLAQESAKQFKKQGSKGTVLFMSSVTAHQAHRNLVAYGMTKAGLEMLAKSLVVELSPYQITVNALAPGATPTERTNADDQYLETWSRITPVGNPARVVDIAKAALFLVSPDARHITGQTLVVDGGWTSVSPQP